MESNGSDTRSNHRAGEGPESTVDLSRWEMYHVHGKTFLGQRQDKDNVATQRLVGVRLRPCWEFVRLDLQTPQGIVGQPMLQAPFGCGSMVDKGLSLPSGGICVALEALAPHERTFFGRLIAAATEGLKRELAVQRSNILLP